MGSLAIDVVCENGVFRPVQPVNLPEGSRAFVYTSSPDIASITRTPGVCGGRACVAGTRITVWGLVAYRDLGLDECAILAAVPSLTSEQLSAALRYAEENASEIARDIAENEAGG
jgi:uncharacterized protein (DUF433 family)